MATKSKGKKKQKKRGAREATDVIIKSAIMEQEKKKIEDRVEVVQTLILGVDYTKESSESSSDSGDSDPIFGPLGYSYKKEDSFFEEDRHKKVRIKLL